MPHVKVRRSTQEGEVVLGRYDDGTHVLFRVSGGDVVARFEGTCNECADRFDALVSALA